MASNTPIRFNEAVDAIRASLDILTVVSAAVALKKAGRHYIGLCPFHKEKTPSFHVSREKNLYKCFGCGEGGDAIRFLMKHQGLGFADVIREQAALMGLTLLSDQGDAAIASIDASQKDRLLALNDAAAHWFSEQLTLSPDIQTYLAGRGYTMADARTFGLGYAPAGWDGLRQTLMRQLTDVTDTLLDQAGLCSLRQEGGGSYDRFRNRLMIPIHDDRGRVVAFGGRALSPNDMPKYMNSPETRLYQKSRLLFSMHRAKDAIREQGRAFIMEGYFDVMRAQLAGFAEAVATCGTALTREHCQLLRRHGAHTLYLCFDRDEAGQRAILSALTVLDELPDSLTDELRIRVIQLPYGKDPDDCLQHQGIEVFQAAVTGAMPHWQYRCEHALQGLDLRQTEHRVTATNQLAQVLQRMLHPVLRAEYARQYAPRLHITADALLRYSQRPDQPSRAISRQPRTSLKQPNQRYRPAPGIDQRPIPKHLQAERDLFFMMFQNEDAYQHLMPELAQLPWVTEGARQLADSILFLNAPTLMEMENHLYPEVAQHPAAHDYYTALRMTSPSGDTTPDDANVLLKRIHQLQSILSNYQRQQRMHRLTDQIRQMETQPAYEADSSLPADLSHPEWQLVDLQYQVRDDLQTLSSPITGPIS